MGSWGIDSSAGDDTMDWVAELEREGVPALEGAIDAVLGWAGDCLEADICARGVAAAEVVAALRGRPAKEMPDPITDWVRRNPGAPSRELLTSTRSAVAAILRRSELQELWEEWGERDEWHAHMTDLQSRLR